MAAANKIPVRQRLRAGRQRRRSGRSPRPSTPSSSPKPRARASATASRPPRRSAWRRPSAAPPPRSSRSATRWTGWRGGLAAVEGRLEAEAVEVAVAVGRKLAPELIAREPFAEIAALATECFKQLVTAPHIVVRVNDALLAAAKRAARRGRAHAAASKAAWW